MTIRLALFFAVLLALPAPHLRAETGLADGATLCFTVGPLKASQGKAIELAGYVVPPVWALVRQVEFQLCDSAGRPRRRRATLHVEIEPSGPEIGARWLGTRAVVTDSQGRFRGTYGAASLLPGDPWPAGTPNEETYRFLLDGRPIATLRLVRSASDVIFTALDDTAVQASAQRR